jgi:hypothetical protein
MHEEKLVAAQDAIAERLYSPLVLAKLGTPDLGDGEGPWIPDQGAIQAFRDDLDIALSSDFRLLVHHFGVEIMNVFGREQMPRLDQDFDRIEQRLMMTFGMNPALLAGNQAGQPYATSALNAELMNQLLHTYQGFLRKHMEKRMKLVAEAQEHYDYEKRGETRVPIMEEVIEYDEEGNPNIVEKNKLLIPDVRFQTFDLRDEQTQRQFLQQLKAEGVPVSDKTMAFGVHFDFEEELEKMQEETIQKTVTQQEAKVQAYRILQARGLPIPPDLKAEIEGGQAGATPPGTAQPGEMGITPPGADMGGMTPEPGSPIVMPPEPGDMMGGPSAPGGAPAAGAIPPGPAGGAPEISSERMRGPGLPTPPGGPGGLRGPRGASVEENDKVIQKLPRMESSATLPELVREKYVEDDTTEASRTSSERSNDEA